MPAAARGRAAGKSAKTWRDALERALNKRISTQSDSPRRLEAVAEAVVAAALAGDMTAAREIGDRLDGKPAQELEVKSETRHYIVRAPLKAIDADQWAEQHAPPPLMIQ